MTYLHETQFADTSPSLTSVSLPDGAAQIQCCWSIRQIQQQRQICSPSLRESLHTMMLVNWGEIQPPPWFNLHFFCVRSVMKVEIIFPRCWMEFGPNYVESWRWNEVKECFPVSPNTSHIPFGFGLIWPLNIPHILSCHCGMASYNLTNWARFKRAKKDSQIL